MEKQGAEDLLELYNSGKATEEQKAWVETWYVRFDDKVTSVPQQQVAEDELYSWKILAQNYKQKPSVKLWPRFAAAASLIGVVGLGLLFFLNRQSQQNVILADKQDVRPGGNNAILTLANGRKIGLTDAANGELVKQSGMRITKTKDGQLVYTLTNDRKVAATNEYNTIETPAGGQYQLKLPDGTNIWLNASSSLRYPVSFTSLKERRLELNGEAFFEVKHNIDQPFRVVSRGQVVEDIGTSFNINSYADESSISTTLLEGVAKVSSLRDTPRNEGLKPNDVILKPGQQAMLFENKIKVTNVNADNVVAWKNGLLMFYDEPLEQAMRRISRWYGVKVVFEDPELAQLSAYGTISKYNTLSKVLQMMGKAGPIRFEVKEKTITVIKSTN